MHLELRVLEFAGFGRAFHEIERFLVANVCRRWDFQAVEAMSSGLGTCVPQDVFAGGLRVRH